jgi:hypothetical protein
MVLGTASAIRNDDQDLSLHTFSYLAIHALVHTRLTPFVIFHALIVKFFLCFASDIRGLYPIMGEFYPNAIRFSTRVTHIKCTIRLHTTIPDHGENRKSSQRQGSVNSLTQHVQSKSESTRSTRGSELGRSEIISLLSTQSNDPTPRRIICLSPTTSRLVLALF